MSVPATQCGQEVMFSKGMGYPYTETYPVTFYCGLDAGHDGPHVISVPTAQDLREDDP